MKPQRKITIEIDREEFGQRHKINNANGCWEWNNPNKWRGYGHYKGLPAHRVSWLIHRGADPHGFYVLHKCDNRCCVNPDHLYLGTQKDNVRDMWERNRNTNKKPAAKHGWAKVNQIRDMYQTGDFSLAHLGRMFDMNRSLVFKIVNNHIWKPDLPVRG